MIRMETLVAEKLSKKMSVCEINENIKKSLAIKHIEPKSYRMDSIRACQFTSFDDIEDMKKNANIHNRYLKVKSTSGMEADGSIEAKVYKKRQKNKSVADISEFL
jgi:hypothetical protein